MALRLAIAARKMDAKNLGTGVLEARVFHLVGELGQARKAAAAVERCLAAGGEAALPWFSYGPVDLSMVREEMQRLVSGTREL